MMGFVSCRQSQDEGTSSKTLITPAESTAITSGTIDSSFVLLPGIAAGKIKINEDSEEVIKVLGRPDSSDAAMQKMVAFWFDKSDAVRYSTAIYAVRDTGDMPKARVRQIRITSPKFKTESGIGVTSTLNEVKKAYKVNKIPSLHTENYEYYIWDSMDGIAFEVGTDSICTGIIIHKKGEALKATNLPLR